MNYAEMTPAKVVVDFVKVRGDLEDANGRGSLLAVLHEKFMAPIMELHREVNDLGIGLKVCAQHCRDLQTGAIHEHPCPTYSEASVYVPSGE